jgi:predicted nucleic acid-binding protein
MSYDFVVDSYAWIEYFRGSESGRKVKRLVEGGNSATPAIVVTELSSKLVRDIRVGAETDDGRKQRLDFVRSTTPVVVMDGDMAVLAGEVDAKRKEKVRDWGLADSIVLTTARSVGAKVVTGDRHFADLRDEVVFVPRGD